MGPRADEIFEKRDLERTKSSKNLTLTGKSYIRRKAILSSIGRYDYVVCRVNRFKSHDQVVRDPNKFRESLPISVRR